MYDLNDVDQVWEVLVDHEIATEEELKLVTNINGYNLESLESIIYARTGLNSADQLAEDLGLNTEE